MTGSPYRTPAVPSEPRPERRDPPTDVDLVPILLLLWVTGVARVVSALLYDEPMRFEPTLALVVAAGIPCLLKAWIGTLLRSAVQRLRRSACCVRALRHAVTVRAGTHSDGTRWAASRQSGRER